MQGMRLGERKRLCGLIQSRVGEIIAYALMSPATLLIVMFFLLPLGVMVVFSFYTRVLGGSMEAIFTLANYQRLFTKLLYVKVFLKTMRIASITTLVSLALSYPLSYFLGRTKIQKKTVLLFLVMFPFWTSVIVRAYAWMIILGNNGLINNALRLVGLGPIRLMWNETGVIIGLVHVLLPYMVLPMYASIEAVSESLEEAARTLGASGLRTFMRVTLPLSLPGAATGMLIVFISAMGFFLVPALLGGPTEIVVPMLIYDQIAILNYPFAAAASVVLLIIVLILVGFFNRAFGLERLRFGI